MLHINQRDKKENVMQHLRILILTALMFSIFFVSPAQAQRGPNSLDDCASNTNAFWSLTYQDTEELHDSNSVRVCAVVDGELGNIPRVDHISSNNDLISLSVELRTGYQVTFFSEINFGGEQLVFTDSRTETNPFEVLSYIVEPLPEVVEPEVVDPGVLEPLGLVPKRGLVKAGAHHTCTVRADRRAVCWGWDKYYSHGQIRVPYYLGDVMQVTAGWLHSCALQVDRRVVCWGSSGNGRTRVPYSVQGNAVQIVAGAHHTCALLADRRVVCWGNKKSVPNKIQGNTVQIAAGDYNTCALQADRTVECWSSFRYYTFDYEIQKNGPDSIQGNTVQIALGDHHSCALQADRRVVCWGYSWRYGYTDVPDNIQGKAVQISAGRYNTCALQVDRRVVCWGKADYGETSVPDNVQGEAVEVTTGGFHSCAELVSGAVECWGSNGRGQRAVPDGLRVAS